MHEYHHGSKATYAHTENLALWPGCMPEQPRDQSSGGSASAQESTWHESVEKQIQSGRYCQTCGERSIAKSKSMVTPFTLEQYAWLLETFGTSSTREAQDGRAAEMTSHDDTSTQEQGPSHTATTGSGEQGSTVEPWEADVTIDKPRHRSHNCAPFARHGCHLPGGTGRLGPKRPCCGCVKRPTRSSHLLEQHRARGFVWATWHRVPQRASRGHGDRYIAHLSLVGCSSFESGKSANPAHYWPPPQQAG